MRSLPGEKFGEQVLTVVLALLFPYSGVSRGVEAIARHSAWPPGHRRSDLDVATRSGALCAIVRRHYWVPVHGMSVRNCIRKEPAIQPAVGVAADALPHDLQITELNGCEIQYTRTVHGSLQTLQRYQWAILPTNAKVRSRTRRGVFLPGSRNVAAIIVAVIQVGAGCITIYRTRGDQLEKYGFASFGFTVLPYVIMSLVNLVGNIVTPQYQSLYMVSSQELDEAELFWDQKEQGPNPPARFDGIVGRLVQEDTNPSNTAEFQQANNDTWKLRFQQHEPAADAALASSQIEPSTTQSLESRNIDHQEEQRGHQQATLSGPDPTAKSTDGAHARAWPIQYDSIEVKFEAKEAELNLIIPHLSKFQSSERSAWSISSSRKWVIISTLILGGIPYAVIGGLTRFRSNQSTRTEQALTMFWLASGWIIGLLMPFFRADIEGLKAFGRNSKTLIRVLVRNHGYVIHFKELILSVLVFSALMLFSCSAISGFVVVGIMLQEHGSCTRF